MARLTLLLLGPFQAALDGKPITTFESDKARALLAFLAVEHARPQPREKLAGLLWPDYPEAAARANLSHALTNLRHATGDRGAEPPVFLSSRQSVQFNHESDAFVDAAAFADLMDHRPLSSPERAVELYRGRFLEGFSVPDSPMFEEWQLLEQEHLHRLAMRALGQLAGECESEGELERALGYARRQLELEPCWESAHQQVMRLLARTGQRDAALAQYQACRRLLAKELRTEPSAETRGLYDQIRAAEVPAEPARSRPARPAAVPAFLSAGTERGGTRPLFVAREKELARLDGYLRAALAAQGQAAFVIGGAGRGKTALLQEFVRRSLDTHPELLPALGTCDSFAGLGDAYLPFRQALGMLTGDVEAAWLAGILTTSQARRTWQALPQVAPILAERGSALVHTLLPGQELLSRVRATHPLGEEVRSRLEHLAGLDRAASIGLEQDHLLEQVANVLLDLSAVHPLLLYLDDLQWADPSSLALLFHLGRRLLAGRILLIGAYRPDEIAAGRGSDRHPLDPVLAEFRRRLGDVWLDLAAIDDEQARHFLDQLLDSEPNALGESFRQHFFERTRGHPLFSVETLRAMQERGDLVRDQQGRWTECPSLDWETMPARAEAVIAERIARLPQALRDILAVAGVEGKEFTAQAVALVLGMDEFQTLHLLHGELAARHRLVRERGEACVGGRPLTRYQFSHFLVQQHVYQGLGEGERRLLHRRVGEALEGLYAGHLEEIAVQLAHHLTGDPERERRYARMAGERAVAQYANAEAVRYLSRALELTPESELRQRCELLLAREQVYDVVGARDALRRDLAELEALAERLGADPQVEVVARQRTAVTVALGKARMRLGEFVAAAAHLEAGLELARRAGDRPLEAAALASLAEVQWRQGRRDDAERHARAGMALAQQIGDKAAEAQSTLVLSSALSDRGELGEAIRWAEACRSLCEQMGDRRGMARAINNLGTFAQDGNDSDGAAHWYGQALALGEEIGDRWLVSQVLINLGQVASIRHEYETAERQLRAALALATEIDARQLQARSAFQLAVLAMLRQEYEEAAAWDHQARTIAEEIGDLSLQAHCAVHLAAFALQRERYEEAAAWAQKARAMGEQFALDPLWGYIMLELLGTVSLMQGDLQEAGRWYGQRLGLARETGLREAEAEGLLLLGLVACQQEAYAEAGRLRDQALCLSRGLDAPPRIRLASLYVAYLCAAQGRHAQVNEYLVEALRAALNWTDRILVENVLALAADAALRQSQPERAAELVGLALKHPNIDPPVGTIKVRRIRDRLRSVLPADELEAALARGAALDLGQIATEILACDTPESFWGGGQEAGSGGSDRPEA